jgi:hypothetical protein
MTALDENATEELHRLIEQTSGRADLEAIRDSFTGRLHRRSDDFDATQGLRLVTAKLQRSSYGRPTVSTSS